MFMSKPTVEQLEAELQDVRAGIQTAIREGDEDKLIRLRARYDVLPVRILNAKIEAAKAAADEIEANREQLEARLNEAVEERTVARDHQKHVENVVLREANERLRLAEFAVSNARNARENNGTALRTKLQEIAALESELDEYIKRGGGAVI